MKISKSARAEDAKMVDILTQGLRLSFDHLLKCYRLKLCVHSRELKKGNFEKRRTRIIYHMTRLSNISTRLDFTA